MTEEQMRAALDGHFYHMFWSDYGCKVIDLERGDKVPPNEDDDEALPTPETKGTKFTKPNSIDWSDKDDRILEMRRAGLQFKDIGDTLGVNRATVAWRFKRLCRVLGIDPDQDCPAYKKYNPQIEAEIVAARDKGETFQSIGQRYGMSKASACTLYHRWYRRTHQDEAA